MTKKNFRKNFPNNITDPQFLRKNYVITHTSGSTASPIEMYIPHSTRGIYAAASLFFFEWAGKNYGEPFIRVWGVKEDIKYKLFIRFIENALLINAFDLHDDKIYDIYKKILKKSPKLLESYTSSAYALALLLEKHDLNLNIPSTVVSGESLNNFHKQIIKKSFNTEIYNRYGTRECGNIGQECPEFKGFHILEEDVIVEILNKHNEPVKTGEKGKVCVTYLNNNLCPFIRYQLDDIGALSTESCNCGRNWQMFKFIEGRISDFIYTPKGKHISLFLFNIIFEKIGYKFVEEFQIVYKKNNELIIKIVPGVYYNKNIEKYILIRTKEIEDSIKINIKQVERIALESSGKKKYENNIKFL